MTLSRLGAVVHDESLTFGMLFALILTLSMAYALMMIISVNGSGSMVGKAVSVRMLRELEFAIAFLFRCRSCTGRCCPLFVTDFLL